MWKFKCSAGRAQVHGLQRESWGPGESPGRHTRERGRGWLWLPPFLAGLFLRVCPALTVSVQSTRAIQIGFVPFDGRFLKKKVQGKGNIPAEPFTRQRLLVPSLFWNEEMLCCLYIQGSWHKNFCVLFSKSLILVLYKVFPAELWEQRKGICCVLVFVHRSALRGDRAANY